MGESREFRGVWFPAGVWLDDRLTAIEKIILIEIDSLDGEDGCFASNEYLANFCQCSISKVSSAISKLKSLGYITVASFDGRKRIIHSKLPNLIRQPYKICEADCQNVEERVLIQNASKEVSKKDRESFDSIIAEFTECQELRELLVEFVRMRKLIKKPLTNRALRINLSKLAKLASDDAGMVEIVEQTVANSWQGFYAPKGGKAEPMPDYSDYDFDSRSDTIVRGASW